LIGKIILTLALAAGLFVRAGAQETLSSVQRELDRVDKEIEREKELHKTERKRAADFETEKAAKLKALQEQLRLTGGRIDSLKHNLDRARQQKASFKGQATLYQAKQKEFVKTLTQKIRDLSGAMKKDFPYQKEKRVTELEELATAIESGVVNVEDGIGRFFTLMQSSLDFAYDTEVYRGTYQATDGSSHEGSYVRLGSALLAFAGEDGQYAAYLIKSQTSGPADSGYAWVDKDLADALRRDILNAAQVAQGKVAPQLVNLPFLAPKAKEVAQ
jgi:hypothetical protein